MSHDSRGSWPALIIRLWQASLKALKTLRTLKVFAYLLQSVISCPRCDDSLNDDSDHQAETILERLLDSHAQRLADGLFQGLADSCPLFTAIEIRVRSPRTGEPLGVAGFLRGRRSNMYGRETAVGIPVYTHLIKHHQPASDILDYGVGPFDAALSR